MIDVLKEFLDENPYIESSDLAMAFTEKMIDEAKDDNGPIKCINDDIEDRLKV